MFKLTRNACLKATAADRACILSMLVEGINNWALVNIAIIMSVGLYAVDPGIPPFPALPSLHV